MKGKRERFHRIADDIVSLVGIRRVGFIGLERLGKGLKKALKAGENGNRFVEEEDDYLFGYKGL